MHLEEGRQQNHSSRGSRALLGGPDLVVKKMASACALASPAVQAGRSFLCPEALLRPEYGLSSFQLPQHKLLNVTWC